MGVKDTQWTHMIIYLNMCTAASCLCIKVMLGLSVWLLSQVRIKQVSQEALHPGGLGASRSRDQRWVQSQVQDLCGVVRSSRPGLGRVETLHGAGQPDQSLEALDVSAAVVHQLVFGHSSATVGRERPLHNQTFYANVESD